MLLQYLNRVKSIRQSQGTLLNLRKELDDYLIQLAVSANTGVETITLNTGKWTNIYRTSASNDAMITLANIKKKTILVNEYLSRNIIRNGDFSSSSFWVLGGQSNISGGVGNVLSTAGNNSSIISNSSYLHIGSYYKLKLTITEQSSGSVSIGNISAMYTLTNVSAGNKLIYFKAIDEQLIFKRLGICDLKIDNVELYAINVDTYMTALGDSITTPPSWALDICYTKGWVFTTYSLGGASIIAHMATQVSAAANDNASIIMIQLGTNDSNLESNMTTLRTTVENQIQALKLSNPNATIYYINIFPRWTDTSGATIFDRSNIRSTISLACSNVGVTCLDTFTDPWITASDTSDGLHPTRAGDEKIKNRILTLLPS